MTESCIATCRLAPLCGGDAVLQRRRFVTLYALQRVVLVQPVHDQHDRALKLVISVSLRPNNERRHGPPPDRPARRCAHAIKRRGLHKVATIRLTAPAYWKFESIPLQQTVRLSPDFASVRDKARGFRQFEDYAGRQDRRDAQSRAYRAEEW
jgi:hypothetical protein